MNVAQPKMTSFAKTTHSNVRTPFQGKSTVRTQSRVPRVSTVSFHFIVIPLDHQSPKSDGFNEFSSNIATAVVCLATNKGDGSVIPTEPHHTPSPQEQHSPHHDPSSPSHPTTSTEPIPQTPTETHTETPTLRQYYRRATRIAQSKALSPAADELASLLRDDSQREAFLIVSSLDAGQDKENINKTSALLHESSPKVTSLDADEGTQDLEISGLKSRVNILEDKDRGSAEPSQEDAPIKGAVSVSPVAGVSTVGVPTVSGLFPTVSTIFTTASVVTPYSRRPIVISAKDKGKEKVVESEVLKKRKLQEQIDAQVAREMKEEFARENQRLSEQLARDSEIARLHAEEELKMMIKGLDRSNEVIAKHLQEYKQAVADLPVGKKIELINELLAQGSAKRMKTSEDVSKEDLKGMMQLVPLEEVYVEALQFDREDLHQLCTLVKETLSIKQGTKDKEKELWVELKRLFKPGFEDQLWTHNQDFIYDPLEWKLYDTCGVYHVFTKDQEIFMLVEKDYPLRKGLATMMI
nr:hypothetical protein [Tanacetum cinerariifolium]